MFYKKASQESRGVGARGQRSQVGADAAEVRTDSEVVFQRAGADLESVCLTELLTLLQCFWIRNTFMALLVFTLLLCCIHVLLEYTFGKRTFGKSEVRVCTMCVDVSVDFVSDVLKIWNISRLKAEMIHFLSGSWLKRVNIWSHRKPSHLCGFMEPFGLF